MGKEKVVVGRSARDKHAIIRISNSSLIARKIAEKNCRVATNCNVRRFLNNCQHLKQRKMQQNFG